MNERIRELAEQANIRFGRMAILDGDPRGMARFVSYSEFEKFAELLIEDTVRKCADYAEYQLQIGGTNADKIKQHFGVEE